MSSKLNQRSILHFSSDIFNLKDNNKPQIKITNKHTNKSNISSYDIIGLSDAPKVTQMQNNNKRKNLNLTSTVFSKEPIQYKKRVEYAVAKPSIILGSEDQPEYHIKRLKTEPFDPTHYYPKVTAYDRKIKQFYGNEKPPQNIIIDLKRNRKSGIGALKIENNKYQKPPIKCNNARERKIKSLYDHYNFSRLRHTSMDNKNKKTLIKTNSAGCIFDMKKSDVYNKIEMLKSNIFNDSAKDENNKKQFATKVIPLDKEIIDYNHLPKPRYKNNLCTEGDEACFGNIDWKNTKTNLLFRPKISKESKLTSFDRKINDLYGENAVGNSNNPKGILSNDKLIKKEVENIFQYLHPNEHIYQIKKRAQNISATQGHDFLNDAIKITEGDRTVKTFQLNNFKSTSSVNSKRIEKIFKNNGIHLFGMQIDDNCINGKEKGKIVFSLRENTNDKTFNNKFKSASEQIKKEFGVDINTYTNIKKHALYININF